MVKTTIYLPAELKHRLEQAARVRRCTEADVIRTALDEYTRALEPARPTMPLFDSGRGDLARNVEKYLEGFGEQ